MRSRSAPPARCPASWRSVGCCTPMPPYQQRRAPAEPMRFQYPSGASISAEREGGTVHVVVVLQAAPVLGLLLAAAEDVAEPGVRIADRADVDSRLRGQQVVALGCSCIGQGRLHVAT